jgi:hypothetical protein
MSTTTDPVELLRSLDADALQARLERLQAEADALRVLLRSARARERGRQGRPQDTRPTDRGGAM